MADRTQKNIFFVRKLRGGVSVLQKQLEQQRQAIFSSCQLQKKERSAYSNAYSFSQPSFVKRTVKRRCSIIRSMHTLTQFEKKISQ